MAGAASRGVEYALALVWGEAALQAAEVEGAGPDTRYCILYCTVLYCTVLLDARSGWAEFLDTVRAEHNLHWAGPSPGSVVSTEVNIIWKYSFNISF